MRERLRYLLELFKRTGERFDEIEGFRLGAAFSFYATFSIFPLVLLAVTVIGFVIGEDESTRERVLGAFSAASSARDVLDQTLGAMQRNTGARETSAAIAIVSLLFSASGALVELDSTLNKIWRVPPRTSGGIAGSVLRYVEDRLAGFGLVGLVALTLFTSLVMSSILGAIAARAESKLTPALLQTAELTLSILLISAVFSMVFHFVPRSRPPLRDVIGGAVLTTVMLTLLKTLFAFYLAHLTKYAAYGVVGGVLALAAWIYLSSQIIFLGATLTRVSDEMLSDSRRATTAEPRSGEASLPDAAPALETRR